jgi:hypothetical protein
MVAFGDLGDADRPTIWTTVSMRHVVRFLQQHLREHWDVLRHAQIRDPAFGVLALLEKWGASEQAKPFINRRQRARHRRSVRTQSSALNDDVSP